jgi:hypothetical protein
MADERVCRALLCAYAHLLYVCVRMCLVRPQPGPSTATWSSECTMSTTKGLRS